MAKKYKTAAKLVKSAIPVKSGKPWYEELSAANQIFVHSVVREVIKRPEAALSAVAENLIYELSINRSVGTVAHTLREMIRNVQKET